MRIHLRRFRTSDLGDFQAYRTDKVLARFQGWDLEPDEKALTFITEMANAPRLEEGIWLQLAICRSDRDSVIGDIGLNYTAIPPTIEIGYTLNRDYHGRGIAQRAVSLAVLWTQTIHGSTDLLAITDVRNTPSINLLERLTFDRISTEPFEDTLEHHYRLPISFRHNQSETIGE